MDVVLNRRGLVIGAVALALAGTGVGVATAGENASQSTEYWPAVQHEKHGPESDPDLFFPQIEDASLTCGPNGSYELRYVASTQPGSSPRVFDAEHTDGDMVVAASGVVPDKRSDSEWGQMGLEIPMTGDAMATAGLTPSNPGWLLFTGSTNVRVNIPGPVPHYLDAGVRLSFIVKKYKQYDDGLFISASRATSTVLPFPGC